MTRSFGFVSPQHALGVVGQGRLMQRLRAMVSDLLLAHLLDFREILGWHELRRGC